MAGWLSTVVIRWNDARRGQWIDARENYQVYSIEKRSVLKAATAMRANGEKTMFVSRDRMRSKKRGERRMETASFMRCAV
jgi:hypothetical protein